MPNIGGALSGFVGGIGADVASGYTAKGDLELAYGDFESAVSYDKAATIADKNAQITKMSTDIQEAQLNRKVEMTLGTERADTGAANLSGGSAGDLLRSSIQQGALAKSLVSSQGAINENAFLQQAEAYTGMASSARAAGAAANDSAQASSESGMFSLIGGAVGLVGLFL